VAISEIISGLSGIVPNPVQAGNADLRGEWSQDWGCHYEHLYNPNSKFDAVVSWAFPYDCEPSKNYCSGSAGCWSTIHFAASSYHPGGVNVGLADGSVTFISEVINLAVWQALGSINGSNLGEMQPSY
jgi:prepilin-type processing-associated H-X9-DG protein